MTTTKKCEYDDYEHSCDMKCDSCVIKLEFDRKAHEDDMAKINQAIGENIQELWRHQRSYADR